MASSDPTQQPQNATSPTPEPPQWYGTAAPVHYGALVAAAVGALGIYLPRHRGRGALWSSIQTLTLFGGTFWGINQLAHDYTGKSITRRTNERLNALSARLFAPFANELPEKAQRTKLLMEAEKARRAAQLPEHERVLYEENKRKKEEAQQNPVTRLWMGGEKEGWQERRMEEERKKLGSGKGYWDLITDQISEVWGKGSKDKNVEEQPKDENSSDGKK